MTNFRLFLRLAFGAIFIWSGIAKLKDPINFADAVRNFEIIGDPIAPALALLIPCFEVVAGILTMAGLFWQGSVFSLLLSLIVFTTALVIAWVRGLDISCGCFGGSGDANYPLLIIRNITLFCVGLFLVKKYLK